MGREVSRDVLSRVGHSTWYILLKKYFKKVLDTLRGVGYIEDVGVVPM